VLTAQILDSDRFATPEQLVGYFGVFPSEASSGCERDGQRRKPRRLVMSPRSNDLVRRYLWRAALSAAQHNPAVRPLYQRVQAKHPDQPSIAIGHAMRTPLHLVFAIWKSGKPFDAQHYPWEQPAHVTPRASDRPRSPGEDTAPAEPAAGHNPESEPERSVVTAAGSAGTSAAAGAVTGAVWIDFAHLRRPLPLARVREHLGVLADLRCRGHQRRGSCPVQSPDGDGRTFSANLAENVWQCFDARCGRKGDVIDLWSAVQGLTLREAALALVRTFGLEPAPSAGPGWG
jgi:hypothetical protein